MIKSKMRWAGRVTAWEIRNAYKILVGRTEGKKPLGTPTRTKMRG
jgi:hypothetical protein